MAPVSRFVRNNHDATAWGSAAGGPTVHSIIPALRSRDRPEMTSRTAKARVWFAVHCCCRAWFIRPIRTSLLTYRQQSTSFFIYDNNNVEQRLIYLLYSTPANQRCSLRHVINVWCQTVVSYTPSNSNMGSLCLRHVSRTAFSTQCAHLKIKLGLMLYRMLCVNVCTAYSLKK